MSLRLKILIPLLAFLTLTLAGEQGLTRLIRLKKMERQIRAENSLLTEQNKRLVREIGSLNDPQFLERLIREEYGYIRPGEQILELPK